MLGYDRLAPQSEKVLQMARQELDEASNLNNPIVVGTAGLVAGVIIGAACARLLANEEGEVKRLRAEASDLLRRIEPAEIPSVVVAYSREGCRSAVAPIPDLPRLSTGIAIVLVDGHVARFS